MSLVAFCVLGLSSCSENDSPAFSSNVLKNTELRNILTSKGFSFDKEGKLELNELATSTVSLDLSSTKLTDLSGLDILPNLKEVKLSNNGYGPTFDFSALPSQITSVDLTGNNIYDFEGLVDVKIENEEPKTTILHDFKKLYLPATAKYNVEDLMPYYLLKGQEADMQMADATGKMQKYNTIREIPDATFNSYVKTLYPSMYVDGNHIDMAKVPTLADQGHSFLYQPDEEEAPEQSSSRREVAPEGKGSQEEEPILSAPSPRESIGVDRSSSKPQEKVSSTPEEAQSQPSSTPQQKKKSSQGSVASNIGRLLGRSLMGFKGDRFVAILTGPYRLVFVTILFSLIFNITLHYILAGQLKEEERLQTEMDDYTKRQQFISSELTHALTQEDLLERLRQQGMTLAPADSAPYIIYVPIPNDLREE